MANHRLVLLINVQKEREEKLQAQFIRAQQQYQLAAQKYQGLSGYRTEYIHKSQQQGNSGMQSRQFNQLVNFIAKLDQAIQQQSRVVQQTKMVAEQRKQSWLAMQTKRKALELLVEKAEQAEMLRQNKREQIMNDEFATQQFIRQRQGL